MVVVVVVVVAVAVVVVTVAPKLTSRLVLWWPASPLEKVPAHDAVRWEATTQPSPSFPVTYQKTKYSFGPGVLWWVHCVRSRHYLSSLKNGNHILISKYVPFCISFPFIYGECFEISYFYLLYVYATNKFISFPLSLLLTPRVMPSEQRYLTSLVCKCRVYRFHTLYRIVFQYFRCQVLFELSPFFPFLHKSVHLCLLRMHAFYVLT